MKHTRQALEHTQHVVYGSRHDNDDIAELGRTAIKGVTVVGITAIAANLMGATIGSFPKP